MTRITLRFAFLALACTLALNAFAKPKSENITLYHDATLNGTNVPAGDYVVKYDTEGGNAQVKFMKGSKEVATATGQVKTLPKKSANSQVVLNEDGSSRSISEIDFGGKDTAISFGSAGAAAGK
jgi:hypothetical protein